MFCSFQGEPPFQILLLELITLSSCDFSSDGEDSHTKANKQKTHQSNRPANFKLTDMCLASMLFLNKFNCLTTTVNMYSKLEICFTLIKLRTFMKSAEFVHEKFMFLLRAKDN